MHERVAVSMADLDDLALDALDHWLASRAPGAPREEAGIKLGVLTRAGPRPVPTLAGLYVFGKVPQQAFPEWGLACVALNGTSLLDEVGSREDVEGPLPALVAAGLAFVARHAPALTAGASAERAVREALVNALVHRELRRTSRVAVRVFTDRVEIWSPGGPPEGLGDLEDLAREGGVSQPRNPIIASIARGLGLGEQLGRGLLVLASSSPGSRMEIASTPRDVLVSLPSPSQGSRH
jgi:predicted HTH transcriptional regulator